MKGIVKLFTVSLLLMLTISYAPAAEAGQAIVTWDPPTTNEDGTPLTDLAGYRLYYGRASGTYSTTVDVHNVRTYTVTNLAEGTWFFAATAYDTTGNESRYSNEVSKALKVAPAPPSGCSVQ